MKKTLVMVLCCAVGAAISFQSAKAVPPLRDAFKAKYAKEDGTDAEKKVAESFKNLKNNCLVCHEKMADGKTDAKKRNAFGKALSGFVKKNEAKDKEKVEKAFEGAAALKVNKDDDKSETFGDRLQAGKLPVDVE